MNQSRSFLDNLMQLVEESFAAFSGLSSDQVGCLQTVPQRDCRTGSKPSSAVRVPSICEIPAFNSTYNKTDKRR